MLPESFAEALSEQWSRWVLEHGLPELPAVLRDGESVPVTWWIGPESAAVLHVRRWPPEDLRDPDDPDQPWTEVDVQLFERVGGTWETGPSGGAGGSWSAVRCGTATGRACATPPGGCSPRRWPRPTTGGTRRVSPGAARPSR